ncbi:RNA recognition motif [Medicago truncatula]|uniref:RNA recognition motif n=1 Tax=Medicago truncatula TaxID=3880 RepID=G7K708_MEDTR|nr:RNA recognition motif [Medicago truncatula]
MAVVRGNGTDIVGREVMPPEVPAFLQHAFATPEDLEWLQKIIFVELPQIMLTYENVNEYFSKAAMVKKMLLIDNGKTVDGHAPYCRLQSILVYFVIFNLWMPSLLLCQFVMDNRFMGRFLDVEMIQKKLVNPTVVTRPYAVKKNRRLIVSNLHPKMTKKHLIEVFLPFGIFDEVSLLSRGDGVVQFVDEVNAAAAAETLSENLRIADKMMKVEFSNESGTETIYITFIMFCFRPINYGDFLTLQ